MEGTEEKDKKGNFLISIETTELVDYLRKKATTTEAVTYKNMEDALNFLVTGRFRHRVASARRILAREEGMYFEAIPNIGIRLLGNNEKVGASAMYVRKISRSATKAGRMLASVDYENLEPLQKVNHNARIAVFAMMRHVTRPSQQKALQGAVSQNERQRLSLTETLSLFLETKK